MKKKVFCPDCGKWLFSTEDNSTRGTVYVWCRQCRSEIKIKLEPLSH